MARASYSFTLRAGAHGEADLSVVRFLGSEAISEPFVLEVDFFPVSGESLNLEKLLAAPGCLTLRRSDGEERFFHGIVSSARLFGAVEEKPRYRATISPKVALLGCGKKSRTFLDKTVLEVVKQLLDGGKIEQRWKLRGAAPWYSPERCYRKKECIAQYVESDLTCFMRLLEREGIFFYFAQSSGGHELVVGDVAQAFEQVEEALPYRTRETANWRADYVFELSQHTRRVVKRVVLRDYDMEHPEVDLTCAAGAPAGELLEMYEYPGGYRDLEDGKRLAQVRLEEEQFGEEMYTGRAESMRLAAGRVFAVAEHPQQEWNQKLLAVRVTHQGRQQQNASGALEGSYQCGFLAISADRPYRPRRRTPRPRIAGVQTATVVGPEGEEIHTDQYGRVKLALHWNGSDGEEPRSGWAPVLQPAAGDGRGTLILPRMKQEVAVVYHHGDPERPVVAKALYHGENRPPVKLPHDKSRTVLRTDSSPSSSGYGYNELAFEDTTGQEKISLHAQRDELIEVLNDKTQQVGGNETLKVAKNRSIEVRGNQQLTVVKDDASRVGANQSLAVAGNREVSVAGDLQEAVGLVQTESVGGERTLTVGAASMETVGAAAALNVGGAYGVNVGGVMNELVAGASTREVGGWKLEAVGLTREERVGGDSSVMVKGDFVTDVAGSVHLSTEGDQKEEVSGKQEIEAQGSVHLSAKEIDWSSGQKLSLVVGGKLVLSLDQSGMRFYGKNFTINGQAIQLRGGRIRKVSPAGARQEQVKVKKLEPLAGDRTYVEIELTDTNGKPLANEPFTVEFSGGVLRKGATDSNGRAKVPGLAGRTCKVGFTRLDAALWDEKQVKSLEVEERSLAGTAKSHTVRAGECVASIAWARGYHWQTLWRHSRNESLRQTRESPNVLLEGDVLFIHDKRLKTIGVRTGAMHQFEVKLPLMPIRIRAMKDGNPYANIPYVLELDDSTRVEGTTDGNGYAEAAVSPAVKMGKLRLETALGPQAHTIGIGHLDPVTDINGLQQRLHGLGFACEVTGELDKATQLALADFQKQSGIEATGQADEQTRKKLLQAHGA